MTLHSFVSRSLDFSVPSWKVLKTFRMPLSTEVSRFFDAMIDWVMECAKSEEIDRFRWIDGCWKGKRGRGIRLMSQGSTRWAEVGPQCMDRGIRRESGVESPKRGEAEIDIERLRKYERSWRIIEISKISCDKISLLSRIQWVAARPLDEVWVMQEQIRGSCYQAISVLRNCSRIMISYQFSYQSISILQKSLIRQPLSGLICVHACNHLQKHSLCLIIGIM